MSNQLQKLKESVLVHDSAADSFVLEKLAELIEQYNLKWIPSPSGDGAGAYFVASHLSTAKGLKATDYANYWASSTTPVKQESSNSLAGKDYLLEGAYLQKFKQLWKDTHNESLGRINSLYVLDWKRAYAYLSQGKTELARNFQSLGATSVELSVRNSSYYKQPQPLTEAELQIQIRLLASLSNIKLRFEAGSTAGLIPGIDEASYRRFDFVELTPKSVRIYELKAHAVTELDIKTCLIDRKYALVSAEQYRRPIEFIFISPHGCSWEAENFISDLTRGTGIVQLGSIPIKIRFMHLHELGDRLVKNIIRINPAEQDTWILKQLAEFSIVSPRTKSKLKQKIDGLYSAGLLREQKLIT